MSKIVKKELPRLKEGLLNAVNPESHKEVTDLNTQYSAMLEEFDTMADNMGVIAFLEARIQETTGAIANAEKVNATETELKFANNMIKTDQICVMAFQIIDAMVKANEEFGQAVFQYASAMDLDEIFDEIENQYGDEIAEEVYTRSKKEQIPAEEALKLIIKEKSLKQSKPNEDRSQESINNSSSGSNFLSPTIQM